MKILSCYGNLEHYGKQALNEEYVSGEATVLAQGDISLVNLRLKCEAYPHNYCRMLQRDHAAEVVLELEAVEQVLGQHCVSPFWTRPAWAEECAELEQQYLLLRRESDYVFVLPLVNDRFVTSATAKNGRVHLLASLPCSGERQVEGTLAVVSKAPDPFEAVQKGVTAAHEWGLLKTPPKARKVYPAVLNKLGWCTWDAFYHDVTEEKILTKLEEFRAKEIPVKWVLIDDGWSQFSDMKLLSLQEDRNKFPNGLKSTIQRMKAEYGIEKVGVWHSLTGYWFGADSESVADGLMNTPQDRIIPGGYEFYRQWHRYLKDQGVDFIKVDCQGNAAEFLKNDPAAFEKVGVIMDGLEQSAVENFDFMINCMGMNNLNAHQHRSSVLLRNSDDFFPNKPEGFREHAVNNIYNAVFTDELFYCDYDMWWSDHADAKRSATLRFLSGGPVYVSDAPDKTDRTPMEPFLAEDGLFRRPIQALKPTYDCLFGFDKVLKAFTKVDNGYAVALFSFEEAGQTMLSAADFGEDGRWQITELYGGASFSLQPSQATEVSLAPADVKVYHLTRR